MRQKPTHLVLDGCQRGKNEHTSSLTVVSVAERDDAGEGRERDRGANGT